MKTKVNKKQAVITMLSLLTMMVALLVAAAPALADTPLLDGRYVRDKIRVVGVPELNHIVDALDTPPTKPSLTVTTLPMMTTITNLLLGQPTVATTTTEILN